MTAGRREFYPKSDYSESCFIKSISEYEEIYKKSILDTNGFWEDMAALNLHWFKRWDSVLEYDFNIPEVKWFSGGKLNVSYNCLDRHIVSGRRNKAAIIWESNKGILSATYTYQQLYSKVNRFANVLRKHGIKKGDRVMIYLPMIPELVVSMLSCARLGAVHSVVFAGFSSKALMERIRDCGAKIVITADYSLRGDKHIPLKIYADEAVELCSSVEKIIVVKSYEIGDHTVEMKPERDSWWHDELAADDIKNYCEPEWMDSEDPLFILYTSGSTGKPKGVLHTSAGYLLYADLTFKWIFNCREDDIHFCTADIGWITGHSYIVYGPLCNGSTSVMFEGIPTYPDPGRFWNIVEKYGVNIFYTAPTAIRALMREGEHWINKYDLTSLRLLGTVGEPINPEAWIWFHTHIGKEILPIVDTYWQTETGGIVISPLPGAMALRPGSACKPFPGILPSIIKEDGSPAGKNEGGYLIIKRPWPGILRGMFGDIKAERTKETYFSKFPGSYFTGDSARLDEDGNFWLMGRIDDVINVSGHRVGSAELESALVSHESVSEAAVVGFPHEIKGEGIYAFVTLKDGIKRTNELKRELVAHVRTVIGPFVAPDKLLFTPGLPKTRSGKIMRRILRNIAKGEIDNLGDISTLADPSIIKDLLKNIDV